MDFTHFVNATGIKKDPFGHSGFTGVDVGNDSHVACPCEFFVGMHGKRPFLITV